MRSHKLTAALALAAGLIAPALTTIPVHAAALTPTRAATFTPCRVEVVKVIVGNVDEKDGQDELRIKVGGNLFPRFGAKYVKARGGGSASGHTFGDPTTFIQTSGGKATFSLREVKPPIVKSGTGLGNAVAHGSDCTDLVAGKSKTLPDQTVQGTDQTFYSYVIRLKVSKI